MQFTNEELIHLSHLARITIEDSQKEKMLHDMQAILAYVSELNSVEGEVDGRDVTAKRSGHYNIVREDTITNTTSEKSDAVLREAPEVVDGYVKVAQVLKS